MSVASISPYETKGGKRYRVRYRRPDGRQTDKWGFRTKREAQAFAATVEVSKLRGEYVAPSLGKATVGELVTAWLERKEGTTRPSYYRTLPSAWKNHVAPTWERVAVAKVDRLDVEEWVAEMRSAELSATVVKRAHGVLCGILDDAVKTGRISVNPARGLDRGRQASCPWARMAATSSGAAHLACSRAVRTRRTLSSPPSPGGYPRVRGGGAARPRPTYWSHWRETRATL